MAEAIARDRLQPALLDRLVDEAPHERFETSESRSISKQRLRQGVLRDLSWLLNAQSNLGAKLDRTVFAEVLKSTLNYGMPPLSGMLASEVEAVDLERAIRKAILAFEPRILPHTLVVKAAVDVDALSSHNVLGFEITGQLWAQPYPLELLLKTALDLETGMVEIRDRDGTQVTGAGGGGTGEQDGGRG